MTFADRSVVLAPSGELSRTTTTADPEIGSNMARLIFGESRWQFLPIGKKDFVKVMGEPKQKPCRACGTEDAERTVTKDGMLCDNAILCGRRYRKGHSKEQYAELLRTGKAPL